MSRVPNLLLLALLAVGAAVHPTQVSAQTEERAVYASVLDRAGAPVTNLTASDFIVREDGISREVLRVEPASKPLHIAVLVDTSQAMRPYIADLRSALRSFFRETQGTNQIALFEFGDRSSRIVDFTTDPEKLEAGVGRLFARNGGGAYLLDAIVDVARDFRTRETARPVIVVITAQGPEFSERFHQSVLDDLKGTDAILHAFVLDRPRMSLRSTAARERELTLSEGTSMTGGRREDLFTSMALKDRLTNLASDLKTQYRVVYARPATLIAPEKMVVRVQQSGLTVRAPRVPPRLRVVE